MTPVVSTLGTLTLVVSLRIISSLQILGEQFALQSNLFLFLALLCSMWDLISLTRVQTLPLIMEAHGLNYKTTKEVPTTSFLDDFKKSLIFCLSGFCCCCMNRSDDFQVLYKLGLKSGPLFLMIRRSLRLRKGLNSCSS